MLDKDVGKIIEASLSSSADSHLKVLCRSLFGMHRFCHRHYFDVT